jgi:NADH:ubiquinone oxidoreductase 49 kD subunit 7
MAECHRQHAASVRPQKSLAEQSSTRQRKSYRNVVTSSSMPFTTREIESPDPVTRVAAADAALREPGQDDIGEKMVLNMGPSHPATHGVLRLVLELDGEIITKATPISVFSIAATRRSPRTCNTTSSCRIQTGSIISRRSRIMWPTRSRLKIDGMGHSPARKSDPHDLLRNIAHFLASPWTRRDGARSRRDDGFSLHVHRARKLYNLFELLTGARFTTSYTRVGGQIRDLPESFIPQLKKFLDDFGPSLDECDKRLLTRNKIFVDRTKDIGVITKERAIAYAISGPNLRGVESNTICAANIRISTTTSTISTWSSAAQAIVTIVIWCDSRDASERANFAAGHR